MTNGPVNRMAGRLERLGRAMAGAAQLGVPARLALQRAWRLRIQMLRPEVLPFSIRRGHVASACDVGANRGDWSDAALHVLRPAQLRSIEPNPAMYEILAARLRGQPGWSGRQAVAGASAGQAELLVTRSTELASVRAITPHGQSLHGGGGEVVKRIAVPMVTLDDELQDLDEITLIKLDVQGFEDQVIEGARAALTRCKVLVSEVLFIDDYYEGQASFLDLARRVHDVSGMRLSCLSEPARDANGTGVWADAVFVRG